MQWVPQRGGGRQNDVCDRTSIPADRRRRRRPARVSPATRARLPDDVR